VVKIRESSEVTGLSQTKSGRLFSLPQVIDNNGEPSRARTCDPLIKSAFKDTQAGYGSYDLLTSVTGCSRQRVYLLPPIISSLSVFLSQVCLNPLTSEWTTDFKNVGVGITWSDETNLHTRCTEVPLVGTLSQLPDVIKFVDSAQTPRGTLR
jgi:hypothetical protein